MPQPNPKAIAPDTVNKLLVAASKYSEHPAEKVRNIALIACLRDTGGRVGGLCGASLGDLDLKTGRLMVCEKGNKRRYVYLNQPALRALRDWLKVRPNYKPQCDRLFLNRDGNSITRGGIYSMLRRLATRAHIPGPFNPHAFRHAFARDMLRVGCDLARVSQMMGHTRITVTADYYAVWADPELKHDHVRYSPGRSLRLPKN